MPKPLLNPQYRITPDGVKFYEEAQALLDPLIKKWMLKEQSSDFEVEHLLRKLVEHRCCHFAIQIPGRREAVQTRVARVLKGMKAKKEAATTCSHANPALLTPSNPLTGKSGWEWCPKCGATRECRAVAKTQRGLFGKWKLVRKGAE